MGVEPGANSHYADSLHLCDEDAETSFSSASSHAATVWNSLGLPKHQTARACSRTESGVFSLLGLESLLAAGTGWRRPPVARGMSGCVDFVK